MRTVLGHFLSGVTVVTAMDDDGEPVGFTCQSFSSLSLEPPLIAIFPARTSSTWPRIRDIGRFCVNVLAQGQADLSARFAGPGDRFDGVAWSASPLGSPQLNGVVAWIDCTLWREYDGGDHTIVAGHVEHLGAVSEVGPLAFHRGTYAQLPT
ncbi:flavin reductase family protein [Jatrophihabitans sp. YIM 134969]